MAQTGDADLILEFIVGLKQILGSNTLHPRYTSDEQPDAMAEWKAVASATA